MFRFLVVLLFLLSAGAVSGQGWERVYDGGGVGTINDVAQTPDGGFIMVGYYNGVSRVHLMKIDADGGVQWTKDFFGSPFASGEAVIVTKDGGYAFTGFYQSGTSARKVYLLKTDDSGKLTWQKVFGGTGDAEGLDLVELPDGSLVVSGYQKGLNGIEDILVLKTTPSGLLQWSKTYGELAIQEKGYGIALAPDGKLLVVGEKRKTASDQDIFVVHLSSATGNSDWQKTYGFKDIAGNAASDIARDVVATNDGHFVLAGKSTLIQGGAGILLKIDGISADHDSLWQEAFPQADFYGLSKAANGGFFVTGSKPSTQAQEELYIVRTDAEGKKNCDVMVGRPGQDRGYAIVATADGGALAAGSGELFVGPLAEESLYAVKADKNCLVLTSFLTGHIFNDANFNCQLDPGEVGLEDWIVKAQSTTFTRYAAANVAGDFQILVDTGTFKIQLSPPNNYWVACDASLTVPVSTFSDTFSVNIPVHPAAICPRNEVDVATPILRQCNDNIYTVRYCNSGTIPSENTTIKVDVDPYLTVKSATLPYTQQGNTYTFNIGTLNNSDCGSFNIVAFLDCNTVAGQTHCLSAHIYPDTFCNTGSWDGSIVRAFARCENNAVKLGLENVGDGDMGTTVGFVITEDVVMLTAPNDPDNTIKLKSKESKTLFDKPASGSTYRIIAAQTPGYPGVSYPTAAVEGCKSDTSNAFSIGFYTMFPDDDADAFVSSDCQENNPADFNPDYFLKRGHPKGYKPEHYVRPETDLEFLIQFRNSGTDTVHQVVVRDTLSPYLDPTTVHPGAASHPYDFDLNGNGVVQFTLPNLNLLPGSSASEGYVKFRVSQKPNLPCNTEIFNRAAIYLDFDAPVLTSQTYHTVCDIDTFAVVKTKEIHFAGADVKVYPNPFDESAVFEVTGIPGSGILLELYDMQGTKILNQSFNHPTFRLYRHNLPAGMFFYRLATLKGEPVASGKLLVR